ncbi:MAG: ribonuclease III [Lachnospiraceae bacterium]|nr:ribonuclease III [Lachnospiraceae bacterium]MBQ7781871.1 ribonuclease III [Lachnospiraceae bacterium]
MGYTLEELEKRINYDFKEKLLLRQAITHSSFSNEQKIKKQKHYERLEFLGDAVLELVMSDFLYHEYEDKSEGQLSKIRAAMVCEPSLALCARDLEVEKFMRLGKGEEVGGGRERDSIIADVMEAIIGAIYLDGGMDAAREFIHRYVLLDLENKQLFYDSKSNLQEHIQKNLKKEFHYEIIEESGPEHDRVFTINVVMEGKVLGTGKGRTKKAAQQQAAYKALLSFKEAGWEGKLTCI